MIAQTHNLLQKVQEFASDVLEGQLPESVTFHDLAYTEALVTRIAEIGSETELSEGSINILQIAGWLQNIGYKNDVENHSKESVNIAEEFLVKQKVKLEMVKTITDHIRYLNVNDEPTDLPQMILYDAAKAQMGASDYLDRLPLLKKEIESRTGIAIKEEEWYRKSEKRLLEVTFHTSYAKKTYDPGVDKNRTSLAKERKKLAKKRNELLQKELHIDEEELKELKKKLKKVDHRPERGVETMFRLASKNHFTLNEMVDKKSSILISINSIILSIIIGTVMAQLDSDPHLVVPVIMLATTNLWSIVLAVFATRPEKTHGKSIPAENGGERTNLLFYGNFHQMTENEYLSGIDGLMNSGDKLYSSLARDVYYLGKTLEKKFSLLRRSFNIFVIGFIASVVTFIVCHLFFGSTSFVPLI